MLELRTACAAFKWNTGLGTDHFHPRRWLVLGGSVLHGAAGHNQEGRRHSEVARARFLSDEVADPSRSSQPSSECGKPRQDTFHVNAEAPEGT